MRRYLWGSLRASGWRTLALLLGIVVATTSFTVLTGAAATSQLEVRGTVSRNFRAGYDLLVRPRGSATPLERTAGLVRANFQSGVPGGISEAQYTAVRRLPGVEVAAPVSNVGYVLLKGQLPVPVSSPYLTGARQQLFRVQPTWRADRGTSRYVGAPLYVYVSRDRTQIVSGVKKRAEFALQINAYAEVVPGRSQPIPVCDNYQFDQDASTMTGAVSDTSFGYRSPYDAPMTCYYTGTHPVPLTDANASSWVSGAADPRTMVARIPVAFPVLLAAVDPAAEDKLYGLDAAIISGHTLPTSAPDPTGQVHPIVPVLATQRSFVDTTVGVTVQRVAAPAGGFPELFARDTGLVRRVARLPAQTVRVSPPVPAANLFGQTDRASIFGYWLVGDASYDRSGTVRPARNPPDAYVLPFAPGQAPPGSDDVQLRPVTSVALNNRQPSLPQLRVVGRYNPAKLTVPGGLTGLSVETYAPAKLVGADPASRRALHGQPLLASGNVAGYPTQPPLLLTTLAAARLLHNSLLYPDDGNRGAAPISVLRVRVADVKGPDAVSRERIKQVALAISQHTGLQVDVVAGASGVRRVITLPPGNHGRPALRLAETWSKKGVALMVLRAVDHKSLALFALILAVCALFVANAASAAVRSRRTELGVLACLGWRAGKLFTAVLAEVALVGLAAGLLGGLLALPLAAAFGLSASVGRAALAVPAAVGLALLAGLGPAWRASRADPGAAVRPAVLNVRRAGTPRGVLGLAVTNLARVPGRSLLGALSLAVGVCALTLLLAVTLAFRGQLVGSLLGDAIAVQIRGVDYLAAGVTVALGAAAVADVLYLNIRERAAEFATLRAVGWREGPLGRLVAYEGTGIGLTGSLVGAAAGLAGAAVFAGRLTPALVGVAAAAGAGGTVIAALAALVPAAALRRLPTAQTLAEE